MSLVLERTYHETGTNGKFTIEGLYICSSIELPERQNKRKLSCILEGIFPVKVCKHSKFGECILIENVPQRKGIYIHAMNDANKQSKGCIGTVLVATGIAQGLHSKDALKALIKVIQEKKIQQITIKS
jgi:hypothetical protein